MQRKNQPIAIGKKALPLFHIFVGTTILLSIAVSCTQDDSPLPIIENAGEPVAVKIIPSGIALYGSVTESGATRSVSGKKERVHFLEDFDEENMLETIIESVPEEVVVPTRAVNLTNTTMRVVVCNSTGDIVTQCAYDVTDGGATPQAGQSLIVLNSSTAYTFHCYSPANVIDTNTKKVTVNTGDNFAYNKVTQIINSSTGTATVTLPTLTPMMSKIKYSVSSTAFTGTITCTGSVKGTFATGTTADWTLGNAALTPTTAADQLLEFTENNQEQTVFSTGATTGELTLTIADLTIGGEAKTTPTLTAASGFTLDGGKMYTVSIKIKKKNYIISPDLHLRVAKGNLMYTEGKWHLAPDQGWYSGNGKGGDYFSWGLTDPLKFGKGVWGSDMSALSDVCVQLLGNGWRIPLRGDRERFKNVTNRVVSTYASSRGSTNGMYWGTTDGANASASQDSYVFLPYAGYRFSENGIINEPGLGGFYWCYEMSSAVTNGPEILLMRESSVTGLWFFTDCAQQGCSLRCVADE